MAAESPKQVTSDEAFLHRYFHHYLGHMYDSVPDSYEKFHGNAFCDGFEERLDPMYLCDAIYELADRLGYKLVDNMWVTKEKME